MTRRRAAAFMTNPCGHTTCGDCGYGWIFRNVRMYLDDGND